MWALNSKVHTSSSPASHYGAAPCQASMTPPPPSPSSHSPSPPRHPISVRREMLSPPTNKYQKMGLRGRLAVNACKSIFGRRTEQTGVAEEADMAEGVMCWINMCVPRYWEAAVRVFSYGSGAVQGENQRLSAASWSEKVCCFLLNKTIMHILYLTFTALFGVSATIGGRIPL